MAKHRVVIAGGGVAALEAAVALHALGGTEVEPVLVCPNRDFYFRAQQVREPFGGPQSLRLPLKEILADLDTPHLLDTVDRVDPETHMIGTAGGEMMTYDSLLLAVGGTPFPAYAHGITFDRPNDPEPFAALLDDVREGLAPTVAFVVPDAGGWTLPAYDLALMLKAWAQREHVDVRVELYTAECCPLEAFGMDASAHVAKVLADAGIEVGCGAEPVLISDTSLLAGGRWHTADRVVSLPRLAGPRLPGVPCDWEGFIEVDHDGRVPGCTGVFAVGDGAAHRRKQGGLAAQQADIAVRILLREAGLPVPGPPEGPTLRGVLATPDGPLFLQAGLGYGSPGAASTASLVPLWDPPSKVATRWLGPYLDGLVLRRTAAFAA